MCRPFGAMHHLHDHNGMTYHNLEHVPYVMTCYVPMLRHAMLHMIYRLHILHSILTALKGRNTKRMRRSLVQNYVHIVFSTKHRTPWIHVPIEQELHAYLAETCKEPGCPAIKVGGYTDHDHILCRLSSTTTLAQLLMKVKTNSSKWMKGKVPELAGFGWQNGYGVFSVSASLVDRVSAYIADQHEHHRKKTHLLREV